MAARDGKRRYVSRRRGDQITAPRIRPGETSNTQFDCGCWKHLDGRHNPGEEMYCYFHKRIVFITVSMTEYVVDCLGCSFRRRHGQNKIGAETQAARHALTRKHRVVIFYGAKQSAQFGNQTGQLTLDAAEPPPF
jgi:hypothetical protein